jgi:hypothetical protein
VVWIGRRRVDVARHPLPDSVAPVRVRRDAFADGVPRRDLLMSPDHAVYVDDVLIPVKHLIGAGSVVQIAVEEIEYWHVELDRHDVLLAEGLPVESFLDIGNRAAFSNHDGPVMMHPQFGRTGDGISLMWEAFGYARMVIDGDEICRVRDRLALRADDTDPLLSAGSCVLRPHVGQDGRLSFHLPRGAGEVVIERRGKCLGSGRFLGGDGTAHDVALDWTDGAVRLAVPDGAFWLELHVVAPRAVA